VLLFSSENGQHGPDAEWSYDLWMVAWKFIGAMQTSRRKSYS
jgi:hypothetical protein